MPNTPLAQTRLRNDKKEKRELAIVDKKEYPIPTEIDVYNNKVMIASWREKLGVIIESQEIADTLKTIFKLAYKEASKRKVK